MLKLSIYYFIEEIIDDIKIQLCKVNMKCFFS